MSASSNFYFRCYQKMSPPSKSAKISFLGSIIDFDDSNDDETTENSSVVHEMCELLGSLDEKDGKKSVWKL